VLELQLQLLAAMHQAPPPGLLPVQMLVALVALVALLALVALVALSLWVVVLVQAAPAGQRQGKRRFAAPPPGHIFFTKHEKTKSMSNMY